MTTDDLKVLYDELSPAGAIFDFDRFGLRIRRGQRQDFLTWDFVSLEPLETIRKRLNRKDASE